VPICGDGFLDINEECDDKNDLPRDGCYLCKIEPNYCCHDSKCYLNNINNCIKCRVFDSKNLCDLCAPGTYLDVYDCKSCPLGCLECLDVRKCSRC
jgi:cysteine-rich repeat protein